MLRTLIKSSSALPKQQTKLNKIRFSSAFFHTPSNTRPLTIQDYYGDLTSKSPFIKDTTRVMQSAIHYFDTRIHNYKQSKPNYKLAIVLDIDETSLNAYKAFQEHNFSFTPQMIDQYYRSANSPAIVPVLDFYNRAHVNDVSLFFITARKPLDNKVDLRYPTIKNLLNAGYKNFSGLFLPQGKEAKLPTVTYKTNIRKHIENNGYKIILNIGDQQSDFEGGYAEHIVKIPNQLYDSSKSLPDSFHDTDGKLYMRLK